MSSSSVRKLCTVLTCSLLLPLAACGLPGSGGSNDTYDPLSPDDFEKRITAAVEDSGSSHASLTRKLASKKVTTKGDFQIDESCNDTRISMIGEAFNFPLDIRKTDENTYIKLGPLTQRKFTVVDDPKQPVGMEVPLIHMVYGSDLCYIIEDLGQAMTSFDKEGESKNIDGVQTHQYEVKAETSKVSAIDKGTRSSMPKNLTFTLYVGTDDLPRRIALAESPVRFTTDFTDWGTQVKVEKPSKSMMTKHNLP